MFGGMKTLETVYTAECKNCHATYGFVTAAERDDYLTTWHSGHDVSRSSEAFA